MFSCCVCNKSSKKVEKLKEKNEDKVKDENELKSPESEEKTPTILNNEVSEHLNGDATDAGEISIGNGNIEKVDIDKDIDIDKDTIESRSLHSESNIPELPVEPAPLQEEIQECSITLENDKVGPPKSGGLFEAPAYIERTIKDGPDDEDGDDSVFESSNAEPDPDPGTDSNESNLP